MHHPHVHFVIPGGGLSADREWVRCRPGLFLPVRVLSRLFRRLFLLALRQAFQRQRLQFFGAMEALREPSAFEAHLAPLHHAEWVVYAKPPFGGPLQVIEYLGRYTHRVALANNRILQVENGAVTFQWKDYRAPHRYKSRHMTLPAHEFMRRFLLHTLPPGFPRIRYFGLLASRFRKEKLDLCRRLLSSAAAELLPQRAACRQLSAAMAGQSSYPCPQCHIGVLIRIAILPAYRWPQPPPDSS